MSVTFACWRGGRCSRAFSRLFADPKLDDLMSDPTWRLSPLNQRHPCRRPPRLSDRFKSRTRTFCREVRMQVGRNGQGLQHLAPADWTSSRADAEKKGYAGTAVRTRLPFGAGDWLRDAGRRPRGPGSPGWTCLTKTPRGSTDRLSQRIPDGEAGDAFTTTFRRCCGPTRAGDRGQCAETSTPPTLPRHPQPNREQEELRLFPRASLDDGTSKKAGSTFRSLHFDAQSIPGRTGQARAKDRGWRIDYILCSLTLADRALSCDITGGALHLRPLCGQRGLLSLTGTVGRLPATRTRVVRSWMPAPLSLERVPSLPTVAVPSVHTLVWLFAEDPHLAAFRKAEVIAQRNAQPEPRTSASKLRYRPRERGLRGKLSQGRSRCPQERSGRWRQTARWCG